MESFLLEISAFFANMPVRIVKARRLVLGTIIALTLFFVFGIATLTRFDMTTDSFLDSEDPSILALNEYRRQFGSDDSVFLVYEARDGDVFSRQSLSAIQALTEDLQNWDTLNREDYPRQIRGTLIDFDELKHIRRVQSIATLRVQKNEGDTLLSQRLVPSLLPDSEAELAEIKAAALAEQDYLLGFYSADARYGALLIQTDFGAQPSEDFTPAVNSDDVSLADSFSTATLDDDYAGFDLTFDESAVVDEIDFSPTDMAGYTDFYNASSTVFEKYQDDFEFFAVGNPPLMEFMLSILTQLAYLGVAVVLIFFFLLWVLFRSFSAVVWPLVTIAVSMIWTAGITVWLGITISQMIGITALLVFSVGIADCVHVMSAYFSFRQQGLAHYDALSKSYGKTGLALLVTSLTTIAGIIALATSDILPIQVFSLMAAMGVALAFLFTIILLPLLLDIWHPGAMGGSASLADRLGSRWQSLPGVLKALYALVYLAAIFALLGIAIGSYIALASAFTYVVVQWQKPILQRIPRITQKHPFIILALFGSLFLSCAYGMSLLRIDTNMTELTREGNPMRVAYDVVDENMAGAQSMVIMVDSHQADGLLEPEVMRAIDQLQLRIETNYADQVTRSYSLANIVKDTFEKMNDDEASFYRIPETQQMISQLLYLFNSANPDDRRSLVSDDYSRANITLNIYNAGSYEYKQFFDNIAVDIDEIFAAAQAKNPELEVYLTGTMALMMRMADEVATSQFASFSLALGVISAIMVITLGSLQAGAIAMIPNVIPALLGFGLMGLLGVPLDTDTILIAPLIIGLAVDDTIHFMTHYRVELIRTKSIELALSSAINEVGQAVMFTTMVLGLGFALLSFSDYLGMAKLGFFGSLAIFVALLCDLFLIPALIIVFKPTFGLKNVNTSIEFKKEAYA
ncbi:MAG: MMPL family transporter [Gammaproteobacteria bacterium]|nr:MMPL family transporter [Gammaproteobacteria bacterium]